MKDYWDYQPTPSASFNKKAPLNFYVDPNYARFAVEVNFKGELTNFKISLEVLKHLVNLKKEGHYDYLLSRSIQPFKQKPPWFLEEAMGWELLTPVETYQLITTHVATFKFLGFSKFEIKHRLDTALELIVLCSNDSSRRDLINETVVEFIENKLPIDWLD